MQWSQNLCRTCGQVTEICHYIYGKDLPNIEYKLKKYLNLNIERNDYKPKQICNSCLTLLNDFSNFVNLVYDTNEKFDSIYYNSWSDRNIYGYHQSKTSVIVSNKPIEHNPNDHGYKVIPNCNITEHAMFEFIGNTEYNTQGNYIIQNSKPEQICYQETTISQQSVVNIPMNENSSQNNAAINYSNTQNPLCDTNEVKKPTYSQQQQPSTINHCDYPIINEKSGICSRYTAQDDSSKPKILENRVINKIPKTNIISAESLCKTVKPTTDTKITHRRSKPKIIYDCTHCHKKFKRRGSLNAHIANSHTNSRPHTCDNCSKSFAVKAELTTHKKVHGDQYKCKYCTKSFSVPSKLQRHLRIHTNDRLFKCDFEGCDRAFTDKRNLDGHKLIHGAEKKYSCDTCKRKFKTQNQLRQHAKSHSSKNLFSCTLCSKKYKHKNNLISHMKRHNDLFCPFCSKKCEHPKVLLEHIKLCSRDE